MDEFDFGRDSDDLAFDPTSDQEHAHEIAGLHMAESLFGTTHDERVKIIVCMLEATFGASDHEGVNAKTMKEGLRLLQNALGEYDLQFLTVQRRECEEQDRDQNNVG